MTATFALICNRNQDEGPLIKVPTNRKVNFILKANLNATANALILQRYFAAHDWKSSLIHLSGKVP